MSAHRPHRAIRARHVLLAWLVIYFPWLPGWPLREWLPGVPYAFVVDANLAGQYALIAFSLVILTGWVGQISLGQGAFVGIGAFTTGLLARNWGVPFPVSLPIVVLVTAGVASLLGLVALRVRGLYLAVATLLFAWMADAYLFSASWFVGSGGSSSIENRVIGRTDSITVFDLSNPRVMYLVTLAAVVTAWYLAVNLRDSKTGRAFFAVRGSEMAAVSLGIDVTRYKLTAFALSGALAGVAGNLMIVDLRAVTPTLFQFTESLFFLGIAIVGGVSSLGGALAAALLFAGLEEVFSIKVFQGWRDVVAIGLLLGVLLGYPGGLGALGPFVRERWGRVSSSALRAIRQLRTFVRREVYQADRSPEADAQGEGLDAEADAASAEAVDAVPVDEDETPAPDGRRRARRFGLPARRRRPTTGRTIPLEEHARRVRQPSVEDLALLQSRRQAADWRSMDLSGFRLPERRADRPPILAAEHVVVRFGGLTAVDDVSLEVREREIVGLIGPNGAGKTTTFNAVAGLNEPTQGTVRMFGEDVTRHPVHVRAQMGMGRTFQLIQLFPELTVFDNLLVATHMQNQTGVFRHLALTDRAVLSEVKARARVRLVVDLIGLEDVADRRAAGLPFGVLRQVEIARALVTGSPLLMLDEPASGLDNAETDELTQLLRFLRAELGVTILLIEHDVRMVTAVTDYMYVLNRGRLIAEGTPAVVQRNPEVVAAYLGQSADGSAEAAPQPEPVG